MSNQASNIRCLTDAELEQVNGGVVASTMAYIHSVFSASASDLILGGKGFVAEAAYDAAKDYLRGPLTPAAKTRWGRRAAREPATAAEPAACSCRSPKSRRSSAATGLRSARW